ncbi:uncharacterized protein LOC143029689 [Oratosquilla oratoria]|uniref:uncharacterized protein LOC143029689 n=1 Tax=Oratosquilla oratoria TaxID=337810 RepID=UPI003F75F921
MTRPKKKKTTTTTTRPKRSKLSLLVVLLGLCGETLGEPVFKAYHGQTLQHVNNTLDAPTACQCRIMCQMEVACTAVAVETRKDGSKRCHFCNYKVPRFSLDPKFLSFSSVEPTPYYLSAEVNEFGTNDKLESICDKGTPAVVTSIKELDRVASVYGEEMVTGFWVKESLQDCSLIFNDGSSTGLSFDTAFQGAPSVIYERGSCSTCVRLYKIESGYKFKTFDCTSLLRILCKDVV